MVGSMMSSMTMTMTTNKRRAEKTSNSITSSTQLSTLHHRLQAALNLGTRHYDQDTKRRKWECKDIEIQKHVLRSISAFLDCASQETAPHNPTVKDLVADLAEALVGILEEKSGATINTAANLVVKFVSCLNSFIPQPYVIDLIHPLTSLAAANQSHVAISSARPLDLLLSNVSRKKEKEVWQIIRESEIVAHLVANMLEFSCNTSSSEYFEAMASLLGTILWRWPQCRYQVWNNIEFLKLLDVTSMRPDLSVKVSMLKLYSAMALCGHGATKILENGGNFLEMMVYCMGSSQPLSLQMEGFKLAQCLMMNEKGGLRLLKLFGEPIVKSITNAMKEWRSNSGKVSNDQILLLIEACRLALITRWQGEHHKHFWRMRVDKVLFDMLLPEFREKTSSQHQLSLDNLIPVASESLKTSSLLVLRPYMWEILGWLATHCPEDFEPNMDGNGFHIDIVISCACLAFEDIMSRGQQICQDDISSALAMRAVLMMIYSPNKYISSKAKFILLKILKPSGDKYLSNLMYSLNSTLRGNIEILGIHQVAILLIGFTCYLVLPQYREVIGEEARMILMAFVSQRLSNSSCPTRSSFSLHLNIMFLERTCCCNVPEDWEGRDILLFYSLWGLTESIRHYEMAKIRSDISAFEMEHNEANLVNKLLEICNDISTGGARWFASYILSYFGFFGFPSKFGEAMGKALVDDDLVDTELLLADGKLLCVHGVVLAFRCPSLLPPTESPSLDEASSDSSVRNSSDLSMGKPRIRIRLSSHVDHTELMKLLDYIYSGYLKEQGDTLKKLKIISKHCRLQSLSDLLSRRIPRWGTPIPTFDLSPAVDMIGQKFSDVILEAKAAEVMSWACKICSSSSVPHIHAHKIVLWASCDHLRAMLQSGMRECQSQVLKVPVRWEALVKLVHWFYSYDLPKLPSGCLWDNLDPKNKLKQLEPYVELCWLAEFWLLEGLQDECSSILRYGLDSSRQLSVKILQIAANFSQWKLAEVAANYMASSYRQLCESGDLEELEEPLVEIVRGASVRLSQEGDEKAQDNDLDVW